jgi:hypothetical protein
MVCLGACQVQAPPAPVPFTAKAAITMGQQRQTAQLTMERPGALRLLFQTPAPLEGMELRLEGDSVLLQYDELQQQFPAAALPQEGAAQLLNQVLLQLAQPAEPGKVRKLRNGFERKGLANGISYTAKLGSDGALKSLRAKDVKITLGG